MASVYTPEQIGVKSPSGGFQQGGWYSGRQFWGGTLSDPGVIHPSSDQVGSGQAVSAEVNAQSAAAQGVSTQQFTDYLTQQKKQSANVTPTANFNPMGTPASQPATQPSGQSGANLASMMPQETINLPEVYKSLYQDSGIEAIQADLSQKEKEYTEAKAKINDNPFLSEATRVGRVAKIEQLYNERTANLRNDVATKKADIETQLALQTQQFDINSQQAQLALSQFNTLLSLGALDNASGEDIAAITRTTGITSGMIQSAIQARKEANTESSVSTWSDGTNDYFITTDQDGNIINRQLIGQSKSTSSLNYSEDPAVSNFIQSFLSQGGDTGGSISDLWTEIEPTEPTMSPGGGGSW